MCNLIIDEGNTLCKVAIADGKNLIAQMSGVSLGSENVLQFISRYHISKIVSCSTRAEYVELPDMLKGKPHLPISHDVKMPITIDYSTPQTLGKDRIAAAVGAYSIYPGHNILIIDIGTAITIDFVDDCGVFHGGAISPGPDMRAKALNCFTGKLPLVSLDSEPSLQGKCTKDAISSGIINGVRFEIEGYISRYKQICENIQVIVSGGSANIVLDAVEGLIYQPNIVLIGLNTVLENWGMQY